MKLKIIHKLLLVATLPIVTLLVFVLNTLNNQENMLEKNKNEFESLSLINISSRLMYNLQLERGISSGFITHINEKSLEIQLQEQYKRTDIELKKLTQKFLLPRSKKLKTYIQNLQTNLKQIGSIRKKTLARNITWNENFFYYTSLNTQILLFIKNFDFQSYSIQKNSNISLYHSVISLEEYAGRERGLVNKFDKNISIEDMQSYNHFVKLQEDELQQIKNYLSSDDYNKFNDIEEKYKTTYFNEVRIEINSSALKSKILHNIYELIGIGGMIHDLSKYRFTENKEHYENFLIKKQKFLSLMDDYISLCSKASKDLQTATQLKNIFQIIKPGSNLDASAVLQKYQELQNTPINIEQSDWFEIATQRINEFNEIQKNIFSLLQKDMSQDIKDLENELLMHIVLFVITIISLFTVTYFIANSIKISMKQLELGINNFFNFLNFRKEAPREINTNSSDEIADMAESINIQMHIIEEHLEDDEAFINEITEIVTLMKDGNFSERPYYEPHNPDLKDLKIVFEQLIELISEKIDQQTKSLERLNASLEDKVHLQTLELQEQIEEITLARDKAIAAELAKDEFLANMSHEIRTPLNAILGFVTILNKQIKDEKQQHYLQIIDKSGKSLLTIISDILDFSKIQSGKFTISPHEINPVEEMSGAILLFASKAYEKNLIYDSYIDIHMPKRVRMDEVRVKQIFSNILSNAIKFTPEHKSINVSVTMENSQLVISVEDTGIGISQENQIKIFNPFEQADGSTTRKYGGTGLGMSISKKLAELMNGTLEVESEEGVGSTFTLKIPIEILDESSNIPEEFRAIENKTIAILDFYKDSIKLKLIKKYLEDFGVKEIVELSTFQDDGYDIIFFIPDDLHNEDIVENNKPAIAILRNSSIQLADLDHIHPLYSPFTPKTIFESFKESGILDTVANSKNLDIKDHIEIKFNAKVLVAEDNEANQDLIALLLHDFGITYTIVNNGLEAYEKFKHEKYDLILTDENMPELNGIAMMEKIKAYEQENGLDPTPIIVVTASVLDTDKEKFTKAGMDGFVGKPIDTNLLAKELSRFIKES